MRTESDLLGQRELPDDALYGIRTLRSLDGTAFSGRRLGDAPDYVWALATVKLAAARANHAVGRLDGERAEAIAAACEELRRGEHREHLVADLHSGGGSIAVNTNVNEVLANLANRRFGAATGTDSPVHAKRHVNASQSTADVCHTALLLAVVRAARPLDAALARLADVSDAKAAALAAVPVIARTCLQDALAAPLGATFGALATLARRRRDALRGALAALRQVNLGGTVLGTGEGAPEGYRAAATAALAALVGEPLTSAPDLYDAAQNLDPLADVSGAVATTAAALLKVAKDLRLMASGPEAGFGELALPPVQEGSSFFAGKINPVVPETLVQCSLLVLGLDTVVRGALAHGELQLNVFEGTAGACLLEMLTLLARGTSKFTDLCLAGIQPAAQRSPQYEAALRRLLEAAPEGLLSRASAAPPGAPSGTGS